MRSILLPAVAGLTLLSATTALRAQNTVIIPCNGASVGVSYCYTDNADHAWHWQSECGALIFLTFSSGIIESSLYDQLMIYDGPDHLAPILYLNGLSAEVDLTGLSFVGTSGDLYMQMTSNATNSCATNGFRDGSWEWNWTVSSGAVGVHEQQAEVFNLWPNPAGSELYLRLQQPLNAITTLRILDVIGRVVYQARFQPNGTAVQRFPLHGLQSVHYSVVLITADRVQSRQLQVIR